MKLSPTTRRLVTALAAIALVGVGGLVALWFAARPIPPLAASPPEVSSPQERDMTAPALPSVLMSADLLTPTGATPLDGLPLNMPLYSAPGVIATKLLAYQREDGDAGEQVATFYFEDADLHAVRAYYHEQAYRLSFTLQASELDSGNRIYTRDDQVLLVRVREPESPRSARSLRLTILLRYTESR